MRSSCQFCRHIHMCFYISYHLEVVYFFFVLFCCIFVILCIGVALSSRFKNHNLIRTQIKRIDFKQNSATKFKFYLCQLIKLNQYYYFISKMRKLKRLLKMVKKPNQQDHVECLKFKIHQSLFYRYQRDHHILFYHKITGVTFSIQFRVNRFI